MFAVATSSDKRLLFPALTDIKLNTQSCSPEVVAALMESPGPNSLAKRHEDELPLRRAALTPEAT